MRTISVEKINFILKEFRKQIQKLENLYTTEKEKNNFLEKRIDKLEKLAILMSKQINAIDSNQKRNKSKIINMENNINSLLQRNNR